MRFNEHSLLVIATDIVERDAAGIELDNWSQADLDQMSPEDRRRILDFRKGAEYERAQRLVRELAAMPIEEIAPRYAHRSAAEAKLAWLDRHAPLFLVAVVLLAVMAYAFGRVQQSAIDFQQNADLNTGRIAPLRSPIITSWSGTFSIHGGTHGIC